MTKFIYRQFLRLLLNRIGSSDAGATGICRNFVNKFNSENNDDIHSNGELRIMREYLPKSRVVFDVGANVGEWARLALQLSPQVQLHCFEPSRPTFRKLVSNSFPGNVTCNPFGLSSAREKRPLYVFSESSPINSLYRREGLEDGYSLKPPSETETVELETLDSYCAEKEIRRIDFLKIDVEGHELEVLKGAQGSLRAGNVEVIQFEYGGCNIDSRIFLKDIMDYFEPLDYDLFKVYPKTLIPIRRYDQRLENFQYQNWIALKRR
jgi:FkbM family methyltransferase